MNRVVILLLLPWLLLSCAAPARRPGVVNYEQDEARGIAAFKKQYAGYAMPEGMDPAFEKTEIVELKKKQLKKKQTLRKAGGISLELELGQRWKTPAGFRTESRYRLKDA